MEMSWIGVKVVGCILVLFCMLTIILDLTPHPQAKKVGTAIAYVSWPLFVLWAVGVLVKGFM